MAVPPNPPVVPADTSPEVWRRQMAIVAAKSVEERLAEWEALNRAGAQMEADAVRRRHPDDDDHDVLLAKLRWRLRSRSEVQWRDCVEIAAAQPLDRAYLAEWADVLGVQDDLAELIAEVG